MSHRYLELREAIARMMRREGDAESEGQGMVEYALVLVLIAIVVLAILLTTGKRTSSVFSNVNQGLKN